MGSWREVLQCFLRGDTRRSRPSLKVTLAAACALLVVAGCGEGEGADEGATVRVYVAAPLCAEAKGELARHGGEAGDLRIRAVCLRRAESDGGLDLGVIGANARRATEDASTVAYIGEPTTAATRFSRPILEAADIPQLSEGSGAAAMAKLLQALERARGDSGSLRQNVLAELS